MQSKLQLIATADDGWEDTVIEIAVLNKDCYQIEQLGLTLAESKQMLKTTQQVLLEQQTVTFLCPRACCQVCGAKLSSKGHHPITYRTLFGKVGFRWLVLRLVHCSLLNEIGGRNAV